MPTLLVIDRDDAYLPRGWVSAVLPDGAAPTEYERSGKLWKCVTVPDGAELAKLTAGAAPRLGSRSLHYDLGKVTGRDNPADLVRQRLAGTTRLLPVAGPDSLDHSHSTVWDYGPGRTYSTPQAAFDALLAQVGSAAFTETHYLRGWSGTYDQGASGNVLDLHTVSPTSRYPLIVDVEAGEDVTFDNEGGDIGLLGEAVNHVRVRDLHLTNAQAAVGPASETTQSRGWIVERCHCDGGAVMLVGVSVVNAFDLQLIKCLITVPAGWGLGGVPGLPDDYASRVIVRGCKIDAKYCGLWNNADVTYLLSHNTIRAEDQGIRHEGTYPLVLALLHNNVFTPADAGFNCISTTNLGPGDLVILHSDGNCFHPGAGNVADLAGATMTLAQWRDYYGGDGHSHDQAPQLDADLDPLPQSPCLSAGTALDREGWDGKIRTASLDQGAAQLTNPRTPGVCARRAAEIRRKL